GAWSAGYNFLIDTTAPAIPAITGPTSPTGTLTPAITWTASTGAVRYDLWVDDQSTGQSEVIRQPSLTTNSFTPTAPLAAGSYSAWVQAFDNTNQTRGWSPTFSFAVTPPPALAASAGASASGNVGSAIQFSGTASGGIGTLSYLWNFGDGSTATSLSP